MPLETQGKQPRENRTADRTRQVYGEPPDWKIVTKSRDGVSGLGKELCLGLTNEGLRGGGHEAFRKGTDNAKIADAFHWSEQQKENYIDYQFKTRNGHLTGKSKEYKQGIPGYKEYNLKKNIMDYKYYHNHTIEDAIRVYKKNLEEGESSRGRQLEQGQSSRGQGSSGEESEELMRQLDEQLVRDRQELEARQARLSQELWSSWSARTRDDGRSGLL